MSATISAHARTERDVLEYAEHLGFGDVYIKVDEKTGLKAIIAIHSTKLGPAIGGTRFVPYASSVDAMIDALRLANMMSYKSAICNLPHGGGKGVIMRPHDLRDRESLFLRYGEFVDSLNGRYIAAMDSGTNTSDMDVIAKMTKHVTCTSQDFGNGDPSPYTAYGVFRGLQAAVKFKLQRDDLKGLHVAIQGVGHVGYNLGKLLHEHGAKLTVCDVNQENIDRCIKEFDATPVKPNEIYEVDCDVFAPCALGSIINEHTIDRLKCPVVAGAANNQLSQQTLDQQLHDRDILYAPDFLINAGGIIHVASLYDGGSYEQGQELIEALYDEAMKIFERSATENKPTNQIARLIAEERLAG